MSDVIISADNHVNEPPHVFDRVPTEMRDRAPKMMKGADGGEAIAIHPVGNLAMSWDHRAFDGAYAAAFLNRIQEIIETRDWEAEIR